MATKKLQVRCAEDFKARIKWAAGYEGSSISDYVKLAVLDRLKATEQSQQRAGAAADYAVRKANGEGAPL
jgi:uncharacterized protein (DUF1778 family)